MTKKLLAMICCGFLGLFGSLQAQSDLVITGVIDGPLSGGTPKAIELYVVNNIADLSEYGIGSANNGGGSDGEEFSLLAVAATAGDFIYIASETARFNDFFGFVPDYTHSASNINGDDAIELFHNGSVVDIFGDINVDGTGEPWEYLDGWAYRNNNTGPDGSAFVLANWSFSGPNALDGESTNGSASTPFPIGTYTTAGSVDNPPSVSTTSPANSSTGQDVDSDIVVAFSESVTVSGAWFTISGSTSGNHTAVVSGSGSNYTLNPDVDFEPGETVTVTIVAAQVADQDGTADNMTANYIFSFSVAASVSNNFVINEIHADPDATNGDANGDSSVDTGDDEFVEIVNNSGASVDISGWTLSDLVSVRHTFPNGTVIDDQCAVVVFAGGTPAGSFGNVTVQTASSGQLGLNNGGDTITLNDGSSDVATVTYGSEGGNNQSLTRDPDITGSFVQHSGATGSGGALFSPGTLVSGSSFSGCASTGITNLEIFEIQGSGALSSYENDPIITENNVVTAVGPEGFFIQTPDARDDGDPQTSNGIYVFTGSTPSVAVGDLVDVEADVDEFFDFTELVNPAITVNSSGNPLPAAVQFDANTPSPNQPQSANEFERFEGMLVEIAQGTVTQGNQHFGSDPIAEVYIVAKAERTFREPGIAYPGESGLPVWDGNPEVFEMDIDKLGLPGEDLAGGSTFSGTGVIGFEFGGYEFWPFSLTTTPATMPVAVRDKSTEEFTVGSLNCLRLFQSDGNFSDRLIKFSMYIRNVMKAPDILAMQEVGGLAELNALATQISNDDGSIVYSAHLIGSNTNSDIFNGYLVKATISVNNVVELGASETYSFGSTTNAVLHDRAPLLLEATFPGGKPITVLNLHQRSLNGIDGSDGDRVRYKRDLQATSVATMIQNLQTTDPNINLVVLGDFNAFQFTDGYVDVVGQIIGDPSDASQALIPGTDIVNPNLTNQVLSLNAENRYSYTYQGDAQVLDHVLTSSVLNSAITGLAYARGNADAAENFEDDPANALRCSDHDGVVLFISNDELIPVELVSFEAVYQNDLVELSWQTASETENAGYHVYRSTSENGQFERINMTLIAGMGNSSSSNFYTFTDVDIEPGVTYYYKIADVDFSGRLTFHGPIEITIITSVQEENVLPEAFVLMQNYPNPFNPETTIKFGLPEQTDVTVRIYNVLGVEIKSLVENQPMQAGYISLKWDGKTNQGVSANTGIYYLRVSAGEFKAVRKMLLIK